MKKVLGSMSKFIFAGFGIAVSALLMSLTYGALQRLFPGNFMNQMWGLVMFDIAAMCRALAFVFQSKSTGQYAAAGIGFIVGFVGTLGMVAAEVIMSGQNLASFDTAQIGRWMVYGFIIVTALHAALVYAHHATSPEISEQINVGVARGEVVTQAISDATKTIEAEKHDLSRAIYYDIVSQVKRDLGLHPIDDTVFDRRRGYDFNLETEDMPLEEWERIENELRDKGYLKRSNLPKPTQESAPRDDRPLSQKFRDWVNGLRQPAPQDYSHLYPPNGDRQHPDLLLAKIPSQEWQKIMKAWRDYENSRLQEPTMQNLADKAKQARIKAEAINSELKGLVEPETENPAEENPKYDT